MFSMLIFLSTANAQSIGDCNAAPSGVGFGAIFDAASCRDVCQVSTPGVVECDFGRPGLFPLGALATAVQTSDHNGFDYTVFGMDNVGPIQDAVCCTLTNAADAMEVLNLFGTHAPDTLSFSSITMDLDLGPADTTALKAAILGRGGNDLLQGSRIDDPLDYAESLAGDDGDDTIRGRGGDDFLFGGDGSDALFGGPGRDVLCGSAGCYDTNDGVFDSLDGGTGDDVLCDADAFGVSHVMVGNTGSDKLWLEPLTGGGVLFGGGFAGSSCEPGGAAEPEFVGGDVPGADVLAAGNCNSGTPATIPPPECAFGVPDSGFCEPPLHLSSLCSR